MIGERSNERRHQGDVRGKGGHWTCCPTIELNVSFNNWLSFNKEVNNRNYNITEVIVSVVEFDRPPISHHLHAESDRHHENRWPCFVTNCRYPTHLHDGIGDVQIHHCFVYGTFYRTSNNDVGGISNWLYPSRHLAIALSTNRTILFMNGKFRFIDRK